MTFYLDDVFIEGNEGSSLVNKDDLLKCLKIVNKELNTSKYYDARLLISLKFTDKEEMKRLNNSFGSKKGETNVLAFDPDIELKDENDRVIGDIAICMDVIRQESMEQNKLITHHFYHLFIHGILHLLGFVHNSKKEASIMEGMEISLLKKIGIADPY